MTKVAETTSYNYSQQIDTVDDIELGTGQWKPLFRGEHWNGKILVQCISEGEQIKLFNQVNGKNICLNGVIKTLAVTALSLDSLGTVRLNESLASATF